MVAPVRNVQREPSASSSAQGAEARRSSLFASFRGTGLDNLSRRTWEDHGEAAQATGPVPGGCVSKHGSRIVLPAEHRHASGRPWLASDAVKHSPVSVPEAVMPCAS